MLVGFTQKLRLIVLLIVSVTPICQASAHRSTSPFKPAPEFVEFVKTLDLAAPTSGSEQFYRELWYSVYPENCPEEVAQILRSAAAPTAIASGFLSAYVSVVSKYYPGEHGFINSDPGSFRSLVGTWADAHTAETLLNLAWSVPDLPFGIRDWVSWSKRPPAPLWDVLDLIGHYRMFRILRDQGLPLPSSTPIITSEMDVYPLLPAEWSRPEVATAVFRVFENISVMWEFLPGGRENLLSDESLNLCVRILLKDLHCRASRMTIYWLTRAVMEPGSLPATWLDQLYEKLKR
jgi:hypothetical protein